MRNYYILIDDGDILRRVHLLYFTLVTFYEEDILPFFYDFSIFLGYIKHSYTYKDADKKYSIPCRILLYFVSLNTQWL
jgi:hypothetical protein